VKWRGLRLGLSRVANLCEQTITSLSLKARGIPYALRQITRTLD
jgi:hypothetical protein